MSTISKSDFIAGVKKSGVIDSQQLHEWLQAVEAESAQEIAAKLIRDQLTTKWQAKYLMSGRTRLDVGSYRLLHRIQRDELGDRFLALHTSLARKVDLLILPAELTKDQRRCDAFMQKASLVAKLDHPNLTHVYDIDREGGRLFLVTEHVEGTALDKVASTELGESEIAKLIIQFIAGIQHAHENNLIHGCISQSDLLLTNEDELKIQNLAVSPIRLKKSKRDATPSDDFAAIAKISAALLNELPPSRRSASFEALVAMFADVDPANADSMETLSDSLVDWLKSNGEIFAEEPLDLTRLDVGGFDQPIATTSIPQKKRPPAKEATEPIDFETQPGILGRLWKENPVAVIATVGVLMILLISGTAWGVFSLLSQTDSPNKITRTKSGMSTNDSLPTPEVGDSGAANKERLSLQQPDFQDVDSLSKLMDKLPLDQESEPTQPPEANTNQPVTPTAYNPASKTPDKTVVEDDKKTNESVNPAEPDKAPDAPQIAPAAPAPDAASGNGNSVGNANNAAVNPNPAVVPSTPEIPVDNAAAPAVPDVLTKISGIGEVTQTVLFKNGVTTYKQLAAMNPQQLQDLLKKADFLRPNQKHAEWIAQAKQLIGDTSAAPPTTSAAPSPAPTETAGPFANFPRLTDLPPIENKEEVKLADLVIKKQYLLGAEIFCEPGVSKTKLIFDLRRTEEDKQKWVVGVKRRPKERPEDIAYFRKSENAFHFQWMPEAEKNKYANFLRNCFLKLILPEDQATFLTLRQPVKMPDLRLTEDSLMNEIEVDLPWLPHPDNVVIEVLPLRVQGVDSTVAISAIEKGIPGTIWLKRQDKTGFIWLQIEADMRSKLKLQSNLVLISNGQSKPIKSLQELADLAALIKQNELVAVTQNRQAQAQKAHRTKRQNMTSGNRNFRNWKTKPNP